MALINNKIFKFLNHFRDKKILEVHVTLFSVAVHTFLLESL